MKKYSKFLTAFIFLISFNLSAQNQCIFEFDGTDDYIRYNNEAQLQILDAATDYTIEAWVYPTEGITGFARILQRYYSFNLSIWKFNADSTMCSWYATINDNSGTGHFFNADTSLVLDQWNHVAVICNSIDDYIKLFVNGVEVTDAAFGPYQAMSMRPAQANDNLYIGQKGSGSSYFKGFIDEIRIKNIAEDPLALHGTINSTPYNVDANTAVLFHFDEGSGDSTLNVASGIKGRLGGVAAGDNAEPIWRAWDYPPHSIPLPVELTSFTANVVNHNVTLRWSTATELNNFGFDVEYSMNNIDWKTIGFVKGSGTRNNKKEYLFVNKASECGKVFYRLKQIDLDGSYEYSNIVEAIIGLPSQYSLEQNYPNPFNPSTNIKFSLPVEAKTTIILFNSLGELVTTIADETLSAGEQEVMFNASNLSSGVYYYKITSNGSDGSAFSSVKKMMLIR